jgi:hypothetical protein
MTAGDPRAAESAGDTPPAPVARAAISTDILHFSERVLVTRRSLAALQRRPLMPYSVLVSWSCDARRRFSSISTRATGFMASTSNGGQAAASTDRHVAHDAERLASMRAWRAAAARAVKFAGISSPVLKYISSGVCPRNAECGSTRLCWST